jgi:hypothetical protein
MVLNESGNFPKGFEVILWCSLSILHKSVFMDLDSMLVYFCNSVFFFNFKGWQFSQAYLSWDKKWNGVTGLVLILSCVCNNVVGSNWFFSSVGLSSIPGPWGQRVRSCFFSSLWNWNDENALKANSEYLSELLCLFLLSNAL